MTLKGNLEVLNLGDIFQSLSLNKHTGTLVVTAGRREKMIYFSDGEIALFSSDKRMRLGEQLVAAGKLSPEDLEFSLGRQQDTSDGSGTQSIKLGEILVEEGFVSQEDVDEIVKTQIEEEIYDLFLWKKADFEFLIDYCPDRLVQPACDVTKLRFHTSSLIMEAARRLDEWDMIAREIPSLREVFRLAEDADERIGEIDLPKHVLREAFLIDGERSIEQIAEESSLTKFELCKLIFELKQRELVFPVTPEELSEMAEEAFSEGRFRQASALYERLVEVLPKSLALRSLFVEALKAFGDEKRAMEQLEQMAVQLERGRDRAELARAYRKILELDPSRRDVQERLRQLARGGLSWSAVRIAVYVGVLALPVVFIAALGLGVGSSREVMQALVDVIARSDTQSRANAEEQRARDIYLLGRELLDDGETEQAWSTLKRLIDRYPDTRAAGELSLVGLPIRVETSPPGRLLYINDHPRGRTPAVVSYLPHEGLRVQIREGDRVLYDEELDPYAYHEVHLDLHRTPRWRFATTGPIRTRPVFFRGAAYVTSLDGKLYGIRLSDQAPLLQMPLREGNADPIGEAVSQPVLAGRQLVVSTLDGNVLVYDLVQRRRLLRHRLSDDPLLAEPTVLDDGDTVVLGGYAGDVVFYALEARRLLSALPLCVNQIRAGIVAADGQVFVASDDNRLLALDAGTRKPTWQHTGGADIRTRPALYERYVLAGDVSGRLYCLLRNDGATQWTTDLGATVEGVATARGLAVVTAADGSVRCFEVATGRLEWEVALEGRPTAPAIAGRSVYLATDAGSLHALDLLDGGGSLWTARLDGTPRTKPVVHDGQVYVGCEDGKLYCFDLE